MSLHAFINNEIKTCLLLVLKLPTQFVPFPVNPGRQMQLKVPGRFSQFALR